ncbi:MAG: class I SAM-dependent methyltransferase [Alphaproteobacteria bacterium]|nr:class I SAM-dependent methyltransferase [Alphaproteobacteria bacterium]
MTEPGFYPATSMPDPDWWQALWPAPATVLTALGIEPGTERVVDLCCGDGLFTLPLAERVKQVIAIDLDPAMVERARTRLAGLSNCAFRPGDAYDIAALAGAPADVVLIANTFHGVPDKERLARAVASALRHGGRFIIVNWHRRPREETTVLGEPRGPRTELRMTPEEVAAVVEPAGYERTRVVELPPYHYGAILTRRRHVPAHLED